MNMLSSVGHWYLVVPRIQLLTRYSQQPTYLVLLSIKFIMVKLDAKSREVGFPKNSMITSNQIIFFYCLSNSCLDSSSVYSVTSFITYIKYMPQLGKTAIRSYTTDDGQISLHVRIRLGRELQC